MPLFNNVLAGAAGQGGAAEYVINRSLRFTSGDSAFLSRTPSSAGNRRTWTWSGWIKTTTSATYRALIEGYGGTPAGANRTSFQLNNVGKLHILFDNGNSGQLLSSAQFRDPSSWFHVVCAVDTSQSTAANRVKIYVNGRLLESGDYDTAIYPSQNYQTGINNNQPHYINRVVDPKWGDWYASEIHLVDGQQLDCTSFGEFSAETGVWNPIKYTGTYTSTGSTTGTLLNYNSNTSLPTYSDQDNNTGTPSVYQMENAFDGNSSTYANMTYLNGRWTRANFAQPITNVTRIDVGWDGEGDVGYNGSVVNSTVGYTGSRQSLTLYNNSGSPITLNNIHMVSQPGNGVCRLYDVTITTTTQSATELTYLNVPSGVNGFHLDFSNASSNASLGYDAAGSNNWTVNNLIAQGSANTFTVLGNASNSGSSSAINVSSLGTVSSTAATYWPADGVTYNHLTADFQSVGTYSIHADPFLSDPSANIVVFVSDNGTSWTSISKGQSPYNFSGRYIQWVRTGSGYGAQNLNADARPEQDSLIDSPSNYVSSSGNNGGNYATFNILHKGGSMTISNGNLVVDNTTTNLWRTQHPTIGSKTGKWYAEFTFSGSDISHVGYGVGPASESLDGFAGYISGSYCWFLQSGFYTAGSYTDTGSVWRTGLTFADVYGIAVDLDNSNVSFYKNGTLVGTKSMVNRRDEVYHIFVSIYGGIGATANFGQRPFAISSVPTGYKSLCTQNLEEPLIKNSSTAFDIDLYTGTGSTHERSEFSFSPDLVWIKQRNTTRNNLLFDTIRGANKFAVSNSTGAPGTGSGMVTSFDDDGFTVGNSADVNQSSGTFCAWCWDAGTSTASNTDGSVTSQVRANQTAGFSIVGWTSSNSANGTFDSIGHGLGTLPGLVITKRNGGVADSWYTAHSFDLTQFGTLNTTNAFANAGTAWGNGITSSVIGMRIGNFVGANEAMIAYCFAPVEGFSSFGSYSGSGNTEGRFVYTGMRPKYILIKSASAGGTNYNWAIVDTERSYFNVANHTLAANIGNGESYFGNGANVYGPNNKIDILSNGFRVRESGAWGNSSGVTYIYAAFAENPFKYARAR